MAKSAEQERAIDSRVRRLLGGKRKEATFREELDLLILRHMREGRATLVDHMRTRILKLQGH